MIASVRYLGSLESGTHDCLMTSVFPFASASSMRCRMSAVSFGF